ncbi:hypothetical protein NPIL_413811 [Nephila pilipes]|uniref:Uncharacterized protein n=1 Tax=Nephila pilipes TaxID=299642 RepID=A0A8X6U1Z7_NEPPI|nr:hypothetical protein NPIL_413811 [Nephila pilipes]
MVSATRVALHNFVCGNRKESETLNSYWMILSALNPTPPELLEKSVQCLKRMVYCQQSLVSKDKKSQGKRRAPVSVGNKQLQDVTDLIRKELTIFIRNFLSNCRHTLTRNTDDMIICH